MPGVFRLSPKAAAAAAVEARDLSIPMIALFPNVDGALKDAVGTGATDPDGLIPEAIRAIKDAAPEIGVMTDVALDCYTDHGHDGVMEGERIVNDASLDRLAEQAFIHAHAGADVVAPSDMMDGRIQAVREALEANGFQDTLILSYAAKFASAFYGPYRDAVGSSAMLKGDKKTYQMDYANSDEALKEVAMDLSEGADAVMVKPGMPYLDIVRRVSETFRVPTFAYQVSGEYAMMQASIANGWLDQDRAILETLHGFQARRLRRRADLFRTGRPHGCWADDRRDSAGHGRRLAGALADHRGRHPRGRDLYLSIGHGRGAGARLVDAARAGRNLGGG